MGLNKNHEVEDFNGVKCAIVEKGVSKERANFLKHLLEFNHYKVEVIASAPPKEKVAVGSRQPAVNEINSVNESNSNQPTRSAETPATPPTATPPTATPKTATSLTAAPLSPVEDSTPLTFNVGVTNLLFNSINAIYGRLLRTPDGHVVTMAYWQQKESISNDQIPYFEHK